MSKSQYLRGALHLEKILTTWTKTAVVDLTDVQTPLHDWDVFKVTNKGLVRYLDVSKSELYMISKTGAKVKITDRVNLQGGASSSGETVGSVNWVSVYGTYIVLTDSGMKIFYVYEDDALLFSRDSTLDSPGFDIDNIIISPDGKYIVLKDASATLTYIRLIIYEGS